MSLHSLAVSFTALGGFVMGGAGSVVRIPTVLAAGGVGIIINTLVRQPALLAIMERR